jgi:hypothetical protein
MSFTLYSPLILRKLFSYTKLFSILSSHSRPLPQAYSTAKNQSSSSRSSSSDPAARLVATAVSGRTGEGVGAAVAGGGNKVGSIAAIAVVESGAGMAAAVETTEYFGVIVVSSAPEPTRAWTPIRPNIDNRTEPIEAEARIKYPFIFFIGFTSILLYEMKSTFQVAGV